jgi:hypothetical protein
MLIGGKLDVIAAAEPLPSLPTAAIADRIRIVGVSN